MKRIEGKIYRIVNKNDLDAFCYVGYTRKMYIGQILDWHIVKYKEYLRHPNSVKKLDTFALFNSYGVENCKIVLLEFVDESNNNLINERLKHHFDTLNCVNLFVKVSPTLTQKAQSKKKSRVPRIPRVPKEKKPKVIKVKKPKQTIEGTKAVQKRWREEHKDYRIGYRKKWDLEKPDYRAQYFQKNFETIKLKRRQHSEANKNRHKCKYCDYSCCNTNSMKRHILAKKHERNVLDHILLWLKLNR